VSAAPSCGSARANFAEIERELADIVERSVALRERAMGELARPENRPPYFMNGLPNPDVLSTSIDYAFSMLEGAAVLAAAVVMNGRRLQFQVGALAQATMLDSADPAGRA
jgi:hypothetical protein